MIDQQVKITYEENTGSNEKETRELVDSVPVSSSGPD